MIRNMKVGAKLMLLLGISLAVNLIMSSMGMLSILKLNTIQDETYYTVVLPTEYLINFNTAYDSIRVLLRDYAYEPDPSNFSGYEQKLQVAFLAAQDAINKYNAYMREYNVTAATPGGEYQQVKTITDNLPVLQNIINNISAVAHDVDQAMSLISLELVPLTNTLQPAVDELILLNVEAADDRNNISTQQFTSSLTLFIVLLLIGTLLLVSLATAIIRAITGPVRHMEDVAGNLAKGNLNVNLRSDGKDEIGMLERSLGSLVGTLKKLTDDLSMLSKAHDAGDIDAVIDDGVYEGAYKELAGGLNKMVGAYVAGTFEMLDCVNGFGHGDFNAPLRAFPGKKARINESVEALRDNLNRVSRDIHTIVKAAVAGRLSERADASHYAGDWAVVISGLNDVLDAVAKPIMESAQVMDNLSRGDFSQTVTGDYQGDFMTIKTSLNRTVANLSAYISEISRILTSLADNNLDQQVTGEYVGEFSSIKDALNIITDKLNDVMGDINMAAQQVAAGAKQISESSMSLAQGATEQASSVEELTATVIQINEKTALNAENAKKAELLAASSKDNAAKGNAEMSTMLDSMEGIKESSNNISKIIQVIEDIALQTNLLALNAAVEAARAGVHGKGFAVVAEEVGALAAKSKEAARQTTEMIGDSIQKVNNGTKIAQSTAGALERIVGDVAEVSRLISGIAYASSEQAVAISQINIGANQIAEVVQNTSATSEECAAAAEELSSQSEILRERIMSFKLRGEDGASGMAGVTRSARLAQSASPANLNSSGRHFGSTGENRLSNTSSLSAGYNTPKSTTTGSTLPDTTRPVQMEDTLESAPEINRTEPVTGRSATTYKATGTASAMATAKPAAKASTGFNTAKPADKSAGRYTNTVRTAAPATVKSTAATGTARPTPVKPTVPTLASANAGASPAKPSASHKATTSLAKPKTPVSTGRTGASSATNPSDSATFKAARPSMAQRTVAAPSAAKVYDRTDFGKY